MSEKEANQNIHKHIIERTEKMKATKYQSKLINECIRLLIQTPKGKALLKKAIAQQYERTPVNLRKWIREHKRFLTHKNAVVRKVSALSIERLQNELKKLSKYRNAQA